MKPRFLSIFIEVVRRSYTASFWVWHLIKNHSPLPQCINNVDYREADQSRPRRLRIAYRRIERLCLLIFVMGPQRHGLCREEGSGSIARAQKDESIGEVHATRVSCCHPSYFGSGSMPKVIVNLSSSWLRDFFRLGVFLLEDILAIYYACRYSDLVL